MKKRKINRRFLYKYVISTTYQRLYRFNKKTIEYTEGRFWFSSNYSYSEFMKRLFMKRLGTPFVQKFKEVSLDEAKTKFPYAFENKNVI